MSLPKTRDTLAVAALFRRSSIIAASMLALSGCVSSGSPDVASAIEPLPSVQASQAGDEAQPQTAGEEVAMAAGGEAEGSPGPEGSADDSQLPAGDASQLASLTMQNTAVNASKGSIFAVQSADGNAAGTTVTDQDGNTYTTPAYVPVPGINPAFQSLYKSGNEAPAAGETRAETGQPEETPKTADNARQAQPPAGSEEQTAALSTGESVPAAAADPVVVAVPAEQQAAMAAQAGIAVQPQTEKKKRTLADFFGSGKRDTSFDQARFSRSAAKKIPAEKTRPVETASLNALPGVTANAMFATDASAAMSDNAGLPMEEDHIDTPVEIAALPGLARLASNGFWMQTEKVDTGCFKPELMRVLGRIEAHYGKKLMVTSGFRSPKGNRARQSLHTTCSAADIQIAGVSKWELAAFLRTMPGRGGVGTYCHTDSVHIDIGSERDWNWRCRRRK